MTDVIIVGAGVTGCAIARELSRYSCSVLVLERAWDVCEGTSKANSGIVHAGFDAVPGSWKARLNLEGSRKMEALSKELDFPYRRNGSLVLCFCQEDRQALTRLYEQGLRNGVEGLEILEGEEVRKLEPNVSEKVVAALHAPSGAIVCPFGLTIALAENAVENGVEFRLGTEVEKIEPVEGGYRLTTANGVYEAKALVNAAGVYADIFHNMVSGRPIHITPRKGEYCLMDRKAGACVGHTLFQMPTALGKGVLVTPTVHGNLLTGPTAADVEDRESLGTTREGLDELLGRAALSVKNLPVRQVITSFAGLRAHEGGGDFILGQPEDAPGFFDAAGMESPGLSCAPAVGSYLAEEVGKYLSLEKKANFKAVRKGIPSMGAASPEERRRLAAENPLYAKVVCRCEMVTEGEIVDAIRRPLGASTLDGVKRRTRAGMGRCQAGFCTPRVVEILARELGQDPGQITKRGPGSELLSGHHKDGLCVQDSGDRRDV